MIYLVYFKVFPCINFWLGTCLFDNLVVERWQPSRTLQVLPTFAINQSCKYGLRRFMVCHSPVGAAQLCGHELAYPQYTSQSSQSSQSQNKTRLYFIQSISQFSPIFTGIAAETLVSGFKPPTQPSFCEKLHQRHDHAAVHTVNKKLHVCKRKKKSGSALQRLLSRCYTRYVLCTRFLWGIVILTNYRIM